MEKYGDLSDKEYLEFLAEIEDADEEIKEIEELTGEKIGDCELQCDSDSSTILSETPENIEIEASYGDNAWRKFKGPNGFVVVPLSEEAKQIAIESRKKTNREKIKRLKKKKIEIQRNAFNQTDIVLTEKIGNENIQNLISLLVKNHTDVCDKYSNYINRRLTMLLSPLIPQLLKRCKKLYPDSVKQCPGFIYTDSKEYGYGLSFFATPDIPYYFVQGTEQSILIEYKLELLFPVDKAVYLYHEHIKKRRDKELKYASKILKHKITTYFELLKLNPFWFEILYNSLTLKKEAHEQ